MDDILDTDFFSNSEFGKTFSVPQDPDGLSSVKWMYPTLSSIMLSQSEGDLTGNLWFNWTDESKPMTNFTFTNSSIERNATTGFDEMPQEMREMSANAKTSVVVYTIIFIVSAAGNLSVFLSCLKDYKKHKSRITLLILHLSLGDMIVTFCVIPLEIFWRITIQWRGGNVLCKICQFIRAFALYLSSMVLICVSFDRFFSILFPLKFAAGKRRVKIMLTLAWIASAIFSVPQAIFFSVESHPLFPSFRQCVTQFLSQEDVRMYSLFSVSAMYFIPLVVIIFTYTAILLKIVRKSRQHQRAGTEALSGDRHEAAGSCKRNHEGPIQLKDNPCSSAGSQTPRGLTINANTDKDQVEVSSFTLTPSPTTRSVTRFNFSRNTIERSTRCGESNHEEDNALQVPKKKVDTSNQRKAVEKHRSKSLKGNRARLRHGVETSTSVELESMPAEKRLPSQANSGSENSLIRTMSRRKTPAKPQVVLRMSENATSNITRAKSRTLRMTIVIVVVFVLCWTPYVVMTLWYIFDWSTAKKVDPRVQESLFMMAVANSCVNPLVYGSFTRNCCGLPKRHKSTKKGRKSGRPTTIKEALESHSH